MRAVVGRNEDLAALTAVADLAVGGRAQVVLVRGPAGIGKTRLLEVAAELMRARSRVLTARGGGGDFTVVRQLFQPVREELAGQALTALYSPDEAIGTYALLQGLYRLAARLLEEGPLTLIVDDAGRCDERSLWWLGFLRRRAGRLPLLILLAERTGRTGAGAERLGELADTRSTVLDLRPLAGKPVRRLLGEALGTEPDDEFTAACLAGSGGNPRALWRLITRLRSGGMVPDAAVVAQLSGTIFGDMILTELDGRPDHVLAVARAAAIFGAKNLDLVPALSGVPSPVVDGAVRILRELRLFENVTEGAGHERVCAALFARLTRTEARRWRIRAARVLNDAGRPSEDVAEQLMRVSGLLETWMIGVLRNAAAAAAARDNPEAALRYLRHALEHDDGTSRVSLLLDAVAPETHLDPKEALRLVSAAVAEVTDPRRRASIAVQVGRAAIRAGRARETVPLLTDALARVRDCLPAEPEHADRELVTSLEASLLLASLTEDATAGAARERARTIVPPAGETQAERHLLAGLAMAALRGDKSASEAAGLARRALTVEEGGAGAFAQLCAGAALMSMDDIDGSRAALTRVIGSTRRTEPWVYVQALSTRAFLQHRIGDLAGADADADTVDRFRCRAGTLYSYIDVVRAMLLLERGDLSATETALERFADEAEEHFSWVTQLAAITTGRLCWARGDLPGAVRSLESPGADPAGPQPWRAPLIEVLVALGDRRRAGELVEQELAAAERRETARARGIALRAAGVVAGGARGLRLLGDAADVLESSPARLELARTDVLRGRALLAADDRAGARPCFRRAVNIGTACDATVLATQAGVLLKKAGGRARSLAETALSGIGTETLTPTERRVLELVADGRRNQEIAERLFVSHRTVEFHLGNIYRKLKISDRKELAARVRAARGQRG
jgi:DNA-binding CsgD family transcriptional regulator